jgi:hypothetical protein
MGFQPMVLSLWDKNINRRYRPARWCRSHGLETRATINAQQRSAQSL